MKIKRYFASDIRTAIRRVRDEQGPDAVILSNRAVDGGVEIVAAVDYDNLLSDLGVNEPAAAPVAEPKPVSRAPAEDDAVARMGRELSSLRGMLEHQLSGLAWGEMGRKHPQRMLLVRRLRELGLTAALAQKISKEIPEQPDMERVWRQALALLAHYLPVTNDDILNRGGVVALVGPTGVGKTTTLAKLAARCILRYGPNSVALITADDQRIGAHDQLRIYGQILGVPVRIARDHAGLQESLAELRAHKLVLVDTAGLSQRDARVHEQLSRLRASSPLLRCYLTLAANSQIAALEETMNTFAPARPAGVILTKIDEAASLGGVLSVLSARGLPAAYVSEGQRIPEDLAPARSHTLVSRCVAITQRTREILHAGAMRHKVA